MGRQPGNAGALVDWGLGIKWVKEGKHCVWVEICKFLSGNVYYSEMCFCSFPLIKFLTFLPFLDHLLVQVQPLFESSIFYLVPSQLVLTVSFSCLPLCCPSISFSVDLCSFSQKLLVCDFAQMWLCSHLKKCQTTLVFCFIRKFQPVICAPPS